MSFRLSIQRIAVFPATLFSCLMGSSASQMQDVALIAQTRPLAAFNPRSCVPTLVKLQEKPHYFHSGRTFIDPQSSATWFETQSHFISGRVTLQDANQMPVANYRPKTFSFKTHYVHAGAGHEGDPIFEIAARYDYGKATTVSVVFTDIVSGVQCEIGFIGNWRRRDACFWLDRGRVGTREMVAKVYCPEGVSRNKYHIDIAPNMDTSLIIMICTILANQQRNHEQSSG